ncbi:MAG TPA: hypothetical protein VEI02_12010, partial [Planctomycetota bacterium]|nr:hypothetical protein [Planctomycetota bacterium]
DDGGAPSPEVVRAGPAVRYDAVLSDDAATLDVVVRVPGLAAGDLEAEEPRLAEIVRDLRPAGPDAVAYRVPLDALAERRGRFADPWRAGRELVFSPELLWLRPRLRREGDAKATIDLPAGVHLVTPWPDVEPPRRTARGGVRRVLARPASADAFGARWALVEREPASFDVDGLDVVVAGLGAAARDVDAMTPWIRRSVEGAVALYGRLAAPRLRVIVVPGGFGRDVFSFGMAFRGGGGAVVLQRAPGASLARLEDDCVAVHEILHLGLPPTARGEAWFDEGFTQYATELVRARIGARTEIETWRALLDGFDRGRADDRGETLDALSATMDAVHAYHRVYWSGAAVALRCDLALRDASGDRTSLDDLLRELAARHGAAPRPLSRQELFVAFDAIAPAVPLRRLCEAALASAAFPDVAAGLEDLGVRRDAAGRVALDDAAPRAARRRAMTAPAAR